MHPHMRGACMAPARVPAGVPARVAGVSDSLAAAGANKHAGILLGHRPRLPHKRAGILSLSSRWSGFDASRRRSSAMHPRLPQRPAQPPSLSRQLTMGCAAKACLRPTRPPTPGEARKVHDTLRTEVPSCLSACLPRLGIRASYLSAPACPCPGIAGIVVVSAATANKPCLSAPAPDHGALAVVRNVGNAACATSCCKQVARCCSHTVLHSPAQARRGGRRTSGRAPATSLRLDGSRGPTRIGVTASRPGAERAPMTALSLSFSHPPSPSPPALSPSAP